MQIKVHKKSGGHRLRVSRSCFRFIVSVSNRLCFLAVPVSQLAVSCFRIVSSYFSLPSLRFPCPVRSVS